MRFSFIAIAGALASSAIAQNSSWSDNAKELFDESMSWLDTYYDSKLGYLYDLDRESSLRHNSRSSVWYALGLLARNEDSDNEEADEIINNLIEGQFTDPEKQWYGTYQKSPEEPEVGSEHYPSKIYSSWDPNWRGFVATTFIVMLEEYSDLISDDTQKAMIESLEHATIGDTYRNGGDNGDNLYPGYSNPAIMRSFVSGWMGRRIDDKNMTTAGEDYANDIIELFNKTETLSEFNSGTYTGVSLFGLVLWSTYLPQDSVMSQMGPVMYRKTWDAVASLWHPGLKNMAGPWDRAYGYDMNRYLSVMALWFWAYLDKDSSSVIEQPKIMTHAADYAWAPVVAVLADAGASLLPDDFFEDLKSFDEERTFEAQAYFPPYDEEVRNITSWLSEKITIGGSSYKQTQLGGATGSPSSFTPAVVQWQTDNEVAFLRLRATEQTLQSEVSANTISLTYPDGDSETTFDLWVSTFIGKPTLSSLDDIPNLSISVSGNVDKDYSLHFAGKNGGEGDVANEFEFWVFQFKMPSEFDGPPKLTLELEVS